MSGVAFEWEVEFDALAAATERCLWGYAPGWVEVQQEKAAVGSVTFRLSQDELGDLGTVTVRKLRAGWSQVDFSGPPLQGNRHPTDEDRAQIATLTDADERRQAAIELSRKLSQEQSELRRRRDEHVRNVITAYLNRLYAESIWPYRRLFTDQCKDPNAILAELRTLISKHFPSDKGLPLHGGRIEEFNIVPRRWAVHADLIGIGTVIVGYLEFSPSDDRQSVYQVTGYGNDVPGLLRTAQDFFKEMAAIIRQEWDTVKSTENIPDVVPVPYSVGIANAIADYMRDEVCIPLQADLIGVGLWVVHNRHDEIGRIRFTERGDGLYEIRRIESQRKDTAFVQVWTGLLQRLREQGWTSAYLSGFMTS